MADRATDEAAAVAVHETLATRVLLGRGSSERIADEAARLGARRALLVAAPSAADSADRAAEALGQRLAARFDRPAPHTPVAVTAEVMQLIGAGGADCVVGIGGGSAIGLAKAVSARTGASQIAVPTTYSGSEATPVLGETEQGVKTTRRDPALAPGTIIYDPDLTLAMPVGLTRTSAVNALAHAVEALWAPETTPVTRALATEAANGILEALPDVLVAPEDPQARERLQSAAWLAGSCLAQARMGLHHQLAHALGGTFDLPHAELHTMLLPHVMAFNRRSAPAAFDRLARSAGPDPVAAVADLARGYDGPRTLAELGVAREQLRGIAERVVAGPYPNPRPLTVDAVAELLDELWQGKFPTGVR